MLTSVTYAFAGCVAAGGAVGYLKSGSAVSGIAGVGFGAVLAATAGSPLATAALSGVLAAVMGNRFLATGKFMPPGLVAIMSAAMCGFALMNRQ
eukprot:TRINITY_DN20150_c0_g1_i1.p2 TRINITY_DN20150_c0_g1~~TRINITY_DN20150_c0_g1_i1.p2  ORF type:complete len:105 (+),score=20.45 TRINITY_DN20150_c0_g1_i1:34-315(+)